MGWYGNWKPYVPVATRRARAARYAAQLAKKEKRPLSPVKIDGRKIATSFWGEAWCDNLERYSDFENRLPRGRTYVRNGSVIDLSIQRGTIKALVSGSEIYRVTISIDTLAKRDWQCIKRDCSRSIDSLIDLLQGRFDQGVMQRLAQMEGGLFPQPKQIKMKCSCPDWAYLCKHAAAVLYGVGARLDTSPELLFTLRDVDHLELVGQAVAAENLDRALGEGKAESLAGSDLGELFGIELDTGSVPRKKRQPKRAAVTKSHKSLGNGKNGTQTATRKTPTRRKVTEKRRSSKRLDNNHPAVVAKPRRAAASASRKRKTASQA